MSSVIEDLAALPRFLTVKETCAFLGVSASTVKRFVKSGDLRQWTPERGHRKITRDSVARARRGRSSLHPEQAEID